MSLGFSLCCLYCQTDVSVSILTFPQAQQNSGSRPSWSQPQTRQGASVHKVWEVEVRPSPSAAGSPDEQCCGGAWSFWGRVSGCPAGRSWLGGGGEAGVEYWPRLDCCRHGATVAACRSGLFLDGSGVLITLASRWWQWWCDSGASSYGGSFPVWLVAS